MQKRMFANSLLNVFCRLINSSFLFIKLSLLVPRWDIWEHIRHKASLINF